MRIWQVDAFTGKPFAGNPAAVCILPEPRDALWMQDVATEMNLSETAFVEPSGEGYGLRWFTPAVEVDLCGHATLASAHVLWEEGIADAGSDIGFDTRSGVLTCRQRTDRIEMDFPVRPVVEAEPPPGLIDALGVRPLSVGLSPVGYLIELGSEDEVRAVTPDFARLGAIPDGWTCVTAPGGPSGFDFVSRFFAPQAGVNEDPVTGAAHCALAHFWSTRSGRTDFRAYQCSARGGVVHARLDGDRVHLGGQAVTVLRGELLSGVGSS
ncbi:MAG: PhzF family phenazine biosynthesis protein [Actinomycetota bacterium]